MKIAGFLILIAVLLLILFLLFGPREPVDTAVQFDDGQLPEDLDAYLAAAEVDVPDLKPGAEKRIVWAGAAKEKTPLAIVYVHGFSATAEEIRPVPDRVAEALGANLYFTRLRGHGRDGAALATASVRHWAEDVAEAMAIGRRLGERVILMGTSTGATVSMLAALDPEMRRDLAGMIFVSPNFGLMAAGSSLLTLPMARHYVPYIAGSERSFVPANADHATYWTTRYPTDALFPMAALVRHVNRAPLDTIDVPVLAIFSEQDTVVSAKATRRLLDKLGTMPSIIPVTVGEGDDPAAHVIAGDILSPGQTDRAVEWMLSWIEDQILAPADAPVAKGSG
ncbi:alpha/beta hydrolase [Oceanomicrobium pacificus]|uniref:Alpha/beta fold hydrolase n=1 Tax=Oceanomicrobium pacificus TaxID=2692916 RepID=A0A6B0TNW9_9RHOB|nr:alpha/beta fold hydrolase [Oceanomicrobium pacificus]MXU65566.1 alpha/beta fold hydrolase [Oceanomicrobium pacificus]